MRIIDDPTSRSAFVILIDGLAGRNVVLTDDVVACVDDHGRLVSLDLMNTPEFGTPFDGAAAARAVAWAREQLALGAVS